MQKTSISENIRLIRESRGYSQEYIAGRLNVTQQAYSNMEKKPENMTLARLKDLAKILDVSLLTLICEEHSYIFNNFNQQGGNAATKMEQYISSESALKIYEGLINDLREEIKYLRK
jgi:transcriptional regulator with XRE-family HTH domain